MKVNKKSEEFKKDFLTKIVRKKPETEVLSGNELNNSNWAFTLQRCYSYNKLRSQECTPDDNQIIAWFLLNGVQPDFTCVQEWQA